MATNRPDILPADIATYIGAHTEGPDQVLRDLQERTAQLGRVAGMQVSASEGALLTLLTRVVGVGSAIEVGTFTGYSSICIARGLADGGRLLCLDVSEEYTAVARAAWAQAGLAEHIELRIGPALDSLRSLAEDATFDLAFIDADKPSYVAYYDELVPRIRPGGVILADNTLWSGRVADATAADETTVAIRRFNDHVAADDRVDSSILPVSDGLTLIRKR